MLNNERGKRSSSEQGCVYVCWWVTKSERVYDDWVNKCICVIKGTYLRCTKRIVLERCWYRSDIGSSLQFVTTSMTTLEVRGEWTDSEQRVCSQTVIETVNCILYKMYIMSDQECMLCVYHERSRVMLYVICTTLYSSSRSTSSPSIHRSTRCFR